MAGKKGSGDNDGPFEFVMEFTPPPVFNIRSLSKTFARMMEETGHPLIIKLPHLSIEFEPGCTAKEIADGYNMALKQKSAVKPSNTNSKKEK